MASVLMYDLFSWWKVDAVLFYFIFFAPNTKILVEWQDTLMDQKGHT